MRFSSCLDAAGKFAKRMRNHEPMTCGGWGVRNLRRRAWEVCGDCRRSSDLDAEARLVKALAELADGGLLASARDIGSGGFAVSLAKACMGGKIGAMIRIGDTPSPRVAAVPWEMLFTEPASAVIVSCGREKIAELKAIAEDMVCSLAIEMEKCARCFEINIELKAVVWAKLAELDAVWSSALESQLAEEVVA